MITLKDQNHFITLKKNDPDFFKYLWGKLNHEIRALPVQSTRVGQSDETITFELRPTSTIQKPDLFLMWMILIKIKSFILILVPLLFVTIKGKSNGLSLDLLSLAFATLALCLIFSGFNIRNDISDYISGFDRVNISFSLKPIVLGWKTADQLRKISNIFIAIGSIFAIPVLYYHPKEILLLGAVIFLLLLGNFLKNNSYKEKIYGEIILFILSGAGIVIGYQFALGFDIDKHSLWFSLFWGALIVFLVHINNFSHLITSTHAGIRNSMTNLGFDRAKFFLKSWWLGCIFIGTCYHYMFSSFSWVIITSILFILNSINLFVKLTTIHSPLSSDLVGIRKCAYQTFLRIVIIFIFGVYYQSGLKFDWFL